MVDVDVNVGMTSFAVTTMGFQVVEFKHIFKNLQKIHEEIYFNKVTDLVTCLRLELSIYKGIYFKFLLLV